MGKRIPSTQLFLGIFADKEALNRDEGARRLLGVILKASDGSGDYYLRMTEGPHAFQTLGPYHSLDSAQTNAHMMCQTDIVLSPVDDCDHVTIPRGNGRVMDLLVRNPNFVRLQSPDPPFVVVFAVSIMGAGVIAALLHFFFN